LFVGKDGPGGHLIKEDPTRREQFHKSIKGCTYVPFDFVKKEILPNARREKQEKVILKNLSTHSME